MHFLNENGIDIKDEFGRTILINAVFYNNMELIIWLLNKGADINSADNNGYTALHLPLKKPIMKVCHY